MKDIKKLDEDLKAAMKSKNEDALRALRMLKTAIKNKEVELIRPLEDKEYLQVINTLVKQRRESVEQFEKSGRQDLADIEKKEIEILAEYLPPSLSEDELTKIIEEAIKETGASSPADMGKVMKAAMGKIAGRADGKEVSALVSKKLQSGK